MLLARALTFYTIMIITAILFGIPGLFMPLTSYRVRSRFFISFNIVMLWALKVVCGVTVKMSGKENIPAGQPLVVMSKHQSTWEAIYLQWFFHPISTILKRELLKIPFFGWGLAQLRPIPIDRKNPKDALRKVKEGSRQRLEGGNSVLIFPEGTRTPVGQTGNYARSGADIALTCNAPILPVAHNAGVHWPKGTLIKYPGTIHLSIGPVIDTRGKTSKQITQEVKDWIEAEVTRMPTRP